MSKVFERSDKETIRCLRVLSAGKFTVSGTDIHFAKAC